MWRRQKRGGVCWELERPTIPELLPKAVLFSPPQTPPQHRTPRPRGKFGRGFCGHVKGLKLVPFPNRANNTDGSQAGCGTLVKLMEDKG